MPSEPILAEHRPRLFFIVGPLRTGSSLMARSIDDHEQAICLCETEINRTLFPGHALRLHLQRMLGHGFSLDQIVDLLDCRAPHDIDALLSWYGDCLPLAEYLYGKSGVRAFGDKSPDFYKQPHLVEALAARYPLVYTVRDPRAIVRSIWRQTDASEAEKNERWDDLLGNIRAWRPYWSHPHLLAARFEDLVAKPVETMTRVYAHLGLGGSTRFLEGFPRQHPGRFLWDTAVNLRSGEPRPFDAARREVRDDDLTPEHLRRLGDDPDIAAFQARFGYAP